MEQKLKEFEENRKALYKRHKLFILLGVVIAIIGIILAIQLDAMQFLFFAILIAVIPAVISNIKISKFSKEFKNQIIKIIIDSELENATYIPSQGINLSEVMTPDFFKKPDRYASEDFLSATYKGIKFIAADINLKEEKVRVDSQGHRHVEYVTYFKGRFITFDYERDLQLIVKCLETTSLGARNKGLSKVETESIAFNKKFKTYANSDHNAFYILTPSLQEKMLELEKMFGGTIFFGFINGKFYLAINDNSDSFDIKISKPIDEKFVSKIKGQINLAPAIIEEFNLKSDKFKINV